MTTKRTVKRKPPKKKGMSEIRSSLHAHYNEMLKASQGYIFYLKALSDAFSKLLEREDVKSNQEVTDEINRQIKDMANNTEKILNVIREISDVANKILEIKKDTKVINMVSGTDISKRINDINISKALNEYRNKLVEIQKQFPINVEGQSEKEAAVQ